MVPPPAKKRRLAAPAAVVSRRTTRSQKPRLSAELLAKVASYSSLGRDLLSLCVVAGPEDCAAIRHTYLRNNLHYLEASLRKFVKAYRRDYNLEVKLCRERYLAWMEVNTDWRRLVTTEQIDSLANVYVYKENNEENAYAIVSPRLPFNNPAVAIELGLMDPLVHLVEEMVIDVNAYRWTTFIVPGTTSPAHLLSYCVNGANLSAFQYLLGRKTIDVCTTHSAHEGGSFTILELCFCFPYRTAFFRELLCHPDCSLDSAFVNLIVENMNPIYAHAAISITKMTIETCPTMFHSSTWNDNFRLLLSAGVDKNASDQSGRDIFQYVKHELADAEADSLLQSALKDALQIPEDWVAAK